ncbi:hypothetical protein OG563_18165 [Nocardia vinacea]|uniref:Uncharacterized protein n=1 Tax=Nocardia vinacea TaxID=96468 RepID=A0ABZ1Z339_9NOCA|nr:hypothetical protein [Nocardia vinacea]
MNTPTPPEPAAPTKFAECRTDPGELTTDHVIWAMSLHYRCPPRCLVLGRALGTLDAAFVSATTKPPEPTAVGEPTHQPATGAPRAIGELDQLLADRIREHHRLTANTSERE